jgi:hypothetical protein
MFLASAALLIVWSPLITPASMQAPLSRANFAKALQSVKRDMKPAQLRQLLGAPDEKVKMGDDAEIWRYGTDGPGTMATLGYLIVNPEYVVVYAWPEGSPPRESLISEEQLRAYMNGMYMPEGSRLKDSPLRLIQVSNALQKLGREKALAVVTEYARVTVMENWLYSLVRVLFVPKPDQGYFAIPRIGIGTKRPSDLRHWPTYPMMIVEDVPVSLMRLRGGSGSPQSPYQYLVEESKNWDIRPTTLRPPDDPFGVYRKVIDSELWPDRDEPMQTEGFTIRFNLSGGRVLRQILLLVSAVYKPNGLPDPLDPSASINGFDFDKYRADFLKLGAKWDEAKQDYVIGKK